MATAGYETVLYIGGTATTMTNEATSEVSAGPPQVFRITDATKRALDLATAVVIRDDGAVDVTSDFTIDFLSGTVTSAAGGYASVTISGKFIPLLAVAEGRSAAVNPEATKLDAGVFGEAFMKSIQGKKVATGEITTLAPLEQDLDAGGGTRSWQDVFDGSTIVLIDVRTIPTNTTRAWAIVPGLTSKSEQAGLVEGSIQWSSVSRRAATQNTEVAFCTFDPTT